MSCERNKLAKLLHRRHSPEVTFKFIFTEMPEAVAIEHCFDGHRGEYLCSSRVHLRFRTAKGQVRADCITSGKGLGGLLCGHLPSDLEPFEAAGNVTEEL